MKKIPMIKSMGTYIYGVLKIPAELDTHASAQMVYNYLKAQGQIPSVNCHFPDDIIPGVPLFDNNYVVIVNQLHDPTNHIAVVYDLTWFRDQTELMSFGAYPWANLTHFFVYKGRVIPSIYVTIKIYGETLPEGTAISNHRAILVLILIIVIVVLIYMFLSEE